MIPQHSVGPHGEVRVFGWDVADLAEIARAPSEFMETPKA
jgi:hypothetical protein